MAIITSVLTENLWLSADSLLRFSLACGTSEVLSCDLEKVAFRFTANELRFEDSYAFIFNLVLHIHAMMSNYEKSRLTKLLDD